MKTIILYVYAVPDEVTAADMAKAVNSAMDEVAASDPFFNGDSVSWYASPYPPKERT